MCNNIEYQVSCLFRLKTNLALTQYRWLTEQAPHLHNVASVYDFQMKLWTCLSYPRLNSFKVDAHWIFVGRLFHSFITLQTISSSLTAAVINNTNNKNKQTKLKNT